MLFGGKIEAWNSALRRPTCTGVAMGAGRGACGRPGQYSARDDKMGSKKYILNNTIFSAPNNY
jgi:hypothetical protein